MIAEVDRQSITVTVKMNLFSVKVALFYGHSAEIVDRFKNIFRCGAFKCWRHSSDKCKNYVLARICQYTCHDTGVIISYIVMRYCKQGDKLFHRPEFFVFMLVTSTYLFLSLLMFLRWTEIMKLLKWDYNTSI